MSWQLMCIALAGVGLVTSGFATAAEPSTDSQAEKPSAAELVRAVYDAQAKILELRSLYLRYEIKRTRTEAAIAANRARLEKQKYRRELTPERYAELRPLSTTELVIAFDEQRALYSKHEQQNWLDRRVFDGTRAVAHVKYFTHPQEQYILRNDYREFFDEFYFIDLAWLTATKPTLWFMKSKFSPEDRKRINGFPEDFAHVGTETVRGHECYVLENQFALRQLLVGVEDGRLHLLRHFYIPSEVDHSAAEAAAAGRTFSDRNEFAAWFATLSLEERLAFHRRQRKELFPLAKALAGQYLDEYRELAPGLWAPTVSGTNQEANASDELGTYEVHLVESKVNEPLDDKLFQLELEDGVDVADLTHDPPLFYKQKTDRTPEEFQAIVDEFKKQNEAWQKQDALRDALVGQPAPALPEQWLNSQPLDWSALKGKVVLLDFWATTCGPCRKDLPEVEMLHKQRESSGIVAIGIHIAGGDSVELTRFAKDQELSYPIVIDRPTPSGRGFGQLFAELSVNAIPYTFLIDRDGRIAAHGSLHDVLPKARQLAAASKAEK